MSPVARKELIAINQDAILREKIDVVLIDFSLTVKEATLIFISGRGSASSC